MSCCLSLLADRLTFIIGSEFNFSHAWREIRSYGRQDHFRPFDLCRSAVEVLRMGSEVSVNGGNVRSTKQESSLARGKPGTNSTGKTTPLLTLLSLSTPGRSVTKRPDSSAFCGAC